jgi:hypothetical protein
VTGAPVATVQPVRSAHPPAWLMRVANPVSRAVAGSPLGRHFGSLAVLHFDGRRSGKRYAVPVMTHVCHGAPVVFTDARWAVNLAGGAPVVVRRGGTTRAGVATVVTDPREAADGLRAVLAGLRNPRGVGLIIDDGHTPTDAELNAVRTMIRLDLDRADQPEVGG